MEHHYCNLCKGSITIRRTAIPSMLVNFQLSHFYWIFHSWSKENIKVLGIGPYLYKIYQQSRFLCLSGHFFVRIYRDFNFVLYGTVPPCDTQLPLKHKCKLWQQIILQNLYIFVQQNALIDIKISTIDICLTNIALKPKTLMFSLIHEWKV